VFSVIISSRTSDAWSVPSLKIACIQFSGVPPPMSGASDGVFGSAMFGRPREAAYPSIKDSASKPVAPETPG